MDSEQVENRVGREMAQIRDLRLEIEGIWEEQVEEYPAEFGELDWKGYEALAPITWPIRQQLGDPRTVAPLLSGYLWAVTESFPRKESE